MNEISFAMHLDVRLSNILCFGLEEKAPTVVCTKTLGKNAVVCASHCSYVCRVESGCMR